MHYEVSYAGVNDPRRAIIDMIQYIGLHRSVIVLREAKRIARIEDDVQRNKGYNGLCAQIEIFCGVSGEPIRRLFAYCGGEEQLQSWLDSDSFGIPKVKFVDAKTGKEVQL